jgi:hypothetical protein
LSFNKHLETLVLSTKPFLDENLIFKMLLMYNKTLKKITYNKRTLLKNIGIKYIKVELKKSVNDLLFMNKENLNFFEFPLYFDFDIIYKIYDI